MDTARYYTPTTYGGVLQDGRQTPNMIKRRAGKTEAPENGDKGRSKQGDETIATAVKERVEFLGTNPDNFYAPCTGPLP